MLPKTLADYQKEAAAFTQQVSAILKKYEQSILDVAYCYCAPGIPHKEIPTEAEFKKILASYSLATHFLDPYSRDNGIKDLMHLLYKLEPALYNTIQEEINLL